LRYGDGGSSGKRKLDENKSEISSVIIVVELSLGGHECNPNNNIGRI